MKQNLLKLCKRIMTACLLFVIASSVTAQSVGVGTTIPNASAALDVFSGDQGLLIPRVALESVIDDVTITEPATSLLVYNTNLAIAGGTGLGFYYNSGTPGIPRWSKLTPEGTAWIIGGNSGLNANTHFVGTKDNVDLILKRASQEVLRFYGGGNMVATGEAAVVPLTVSGSGTRMMYLPAGKGGAFRVGTIINGNMWDEASIGISSFASGFNTTASGSYSFATGGGTIAAGFGSFAAGLNTQANTYGSVALGNAAIASGIGAVAIGEGVRAEGIAATALGTNTTASGNRSTTLGISTTASQAQATAMGNGTTASGINATAMGLNTTASGLNATAMGNATTASGSNSTSFGFGSVAEGQNSFGIGNSALAIGANSFAGGSGSQTTSTGVSAFAFGFDASAEGNSAAAIGNNAVAVANYSTAFGLNTRSQALFSTTFGEGTISSTRNGFVIGRYNLDTADINNFFTPTRIVFAIGNGTTDAIRSNAVFFRSNGNGTIAGTLTQNSDIRLKEKIKPIFDVLNKINNIQPISYNFINKETHPADRQIGFSAQEIEKEFPELVSKDEKGYLSVSYANMTAVAIEAIKEQQKIINQLVKQNKKLESRLKKLEKK